MSNLAKYVVLILVAAAVAAVPAAADTFPITVCNNVGLCPSLPAGTIHVTQGTNALNFVITFNNYPLQNLQYALGSQGGGDTFGMQLTGISLTGFSLSNVDGDLYGGASLDTGWVVDPAGTHLDGFGDWNFGIDNPLVHTGTPTSALTYLSFTLNKTGLTLANLTFNSPDSNCTNAGTQCYFAFHMNAINTLSGTQNFATGYGGAPKGADVPEPGSLVLLGSGLLALAGAARRKLFP